MSAAEPKNKISVVFSYYYKFYAIFLQIGVQRYAFSFKYTIKIDKILEFEEKSFKMLTICIFMPKNFVAFLGYNDEVNLVFSV